MTQSRKNCIYSSFPYNEYIDSFTNMLKSLCVHRSTHSDSRIVKKYELEKCRKYKQLQKKGRGTK